MFGGAFWRDVSTTEYCMARWTHNHMRIRRWRGLLKYAKVCTNWQIHRTTFGGLFSTSRDILIHLPASKGAFLSTQKIGNRLNEIRLRARQSATCVTLGVLHRLERLACCHRYRNLTNEWYRVLFTWKILLLFMNEWRPSTWVSSRATPLGSPYRRECFLPHSGHNGLKWQWSGIMFG